MSATDCKNPIFIVGAPRSGTTLLRSVLDAHPNICCPTWETGLFDRMNLFVTGDFERPRGSTKGAEANFCTLERQVVIGWMRDASYALMDLLVGQSGKPRWGEKTPAHVFHMRLILDVFPGAQFVHIIRDGRDVVKSLQNVEWNPGDVRWSVGRWMDSVSAGRTAGASLRPDQYLEVRYEELTSTPEQTLKRICEYLNEDFTPRMLDFDKPQNNSWGLRLDRGIQKKGINKNRELNLIERAVLKVRGGAMLRELGYSDAL